MGSMGNKTVLSCALLVTCLVVLAGCTKQCIVSYKDNCFKNINENLSGIFPKDPIGYIGEEVDLICTVTTIKGSKLPSNAALTLKGQWNRTLMNMQHKVLVKNSTTIIIKLTEIIKMPATKEEYGKEIQCHLEFGDCCDHVGYQLMFIDTRPRPVNNVSCEVYNWENMTCVLDLGANYRYGKSINVFWDWTVENTFSPCPHLLIKLEQQKVICKWRKDDGLDSYKGLEYLFKITVGNSLHKDNVTSIIKTQLSVKPAPVENLRVVPGTSNSTALTLAWSHRTRSSSLRYSLQYVSEWNGSICKELFKTDPSTTLTGLKPYTNYTITISVVPINTSGQPVGFCSDPTTITVSTPPDVPATNPRMMPGFFNCLSPSCDDIVIYWMSVDKKDLHGQFSFINVTFLYTNGSGFYKIVNDSGLTSMEMSKICTSCEIRVDIRLKNTVGFSKKNPSYLILFPLSKRPDVTLAKLRVEALSERKIFMEWNKLTDKDITNYSLCRCRKDTLGNACEGQIRCKIVRKTSSNLTIELEEGTYKDYKFGISVEKQSRKGAFISSGVLWNTCTYLKYGTPSSVPAVNANPDNEAKAVSISWATYPCSPDFGPVVGYRITYCWKQHKNCSDIDVGPYSSNYTIAGLQFGDYQYAVKGVFKAETGTQFGPSYNGSIVIVSGGEKEVIAQGENIESSSSPTSIIIPVVCVAIVIIIVIIIIVVMLRKKNAELEEDTRNIDMPEIRPQKANTSPKSVRGHRDSGIGADSASNLNNNSNETNGSANRIEMDIINLEDQQAEDGHHDEKCSSENSPQNSLQPYVKASTSPNAPEEHPPNDYITQENIQHVQRGIMNNTNLNTVSQISSEECEPLLSDPQPERTINSCLEDCASQQPFLANNVSDDTQALPHGSVKPYVLVAEDNTDTLFSNTNSDVPSSEKVTQDNPYIHLN